MSYKRRAGRSGTVPGCTMGPKGSVDFDDLIKRSGGMFVDKDFPAGEFAIWTEGTRSGFGSITGIKKVMRQPSAHGFAPRCLSRCGLTCRLLHRPIG